MVRGSLQSSASVFPDLEHHVPISNEAIAGLARAYVAGLSTGEKPGPI